jgi:hypothetical protein
MHDDRSERMVRGMWTRQGETKFRDPVSDATHLEEPSVSDVVHGVIIAYECSRR